MYYLPVLIAILHQQIVLIVSKTIQQVPSYFSYELKAKTGIQYNKQT